jgi:hypothetical protein
MTDHIKGYLVILDKDYHEDGAKHILEAIGMIKGVRKVTPYVAGAEDIISYQNGFMDCKMKILEKMRED